MKLTVVVTCKDRDNLRWCISSIQACNPRPLCIIVDFGSKNPINVGNSSWLRAIRVDRNTELFHKARAINIGIRAVTTPYLCITDADQIFQPNFFGVMLKTVSTIPNSFVMCKTWSLLRHPADVPFDVHGHIYASILSEAKKSGVPLHGDGCCNGVATQWATSVRGYDETYVGYRAQDSNFALRAVMGGLKKVWIEGKTSMVHLPHERVGAYYSTKYVVFNKKKYKKQTQLPASKLIVANVSGHWGER